MLVDRGARTTLGNAIAVGRGARRLDASEVVVVTSGWHARRAGVLVRAALLGSGAKLRVAPTAETATRSRASASSRHGRSFRSLRSSPPGPARLQNVSFRWIVAIAVLAVAGVAAGCGGSDNESETETSPTAEWADGFCGAVSDGPTSCRPPTALQNPSAGRPWDRSFALVVAPPQPPATSASARRAIAAIQRKLTFGT